MDTLQTMMHALQRDPGRVAMWHEAGHAVVAMHFGAKVYYYGLSPMPHALVNSLRLTKHQKGVLLAAGAAMTEAVYGFEWGGEASDYKMAAALGDLEVFKTEARVLVRGLLPQAKYLVEQRLGKDTAGVEENLSFVEKLTEDMPHFAVAVKAAKKGVMPEWLKGVVMAFARFQMRKPAFVAKYLGV